MSLYNWLQKLESFLEYIKEETLTEVLKFEQELNEGIEIVFDEITSRLTIKKV